MIAKLLGGPASDPPEIPLVIELFLRYVANFVTFEFDVIMIFAVHLHAFWEIGLGVQAAICAARAALYFLQIRGQAVVPPEAWESP